MEEEVEEDLGDSDYTTVWTYYSPKTIPWKSRIIEKKFIVLPCKHLHFLTTPRVLLLPASLKVQNFMY